MRSGQAAVGESMAPPTTISGSLTPTEVRVTPADGKPSTTCHTPLGSAADGVELGVLMGASGVAVTFGVNRGVAGLPGDAA